MVSRRLQALLLASGVIAGTALGESWSHIEYGAANVTSGATVADPRAPKDERDRRYHALYSRLDALVRTHGASAKGIFYVNDLDPTETGRAANLLYLYAQNKGWNVEVRSLPGDFNRIDLPVTDTAALSNPEGDFFEGAQATKTLQHLADHTRSGLWFTTAVRAAATMGYESLGEGPEYFNPRGVPIRRRTETFLVPSKRTVPATAQAIGSRCPVVLDELGAARVP
jgi:hypothetical protein